MRLGISLTMSFIVSIPSANDVASGVLLFIVALDEGSAFESGRRLGPILKSVEDQPAVMEAVKISGIESFAIVCDDEDVCLGEVEPWAPLEDVGGETGALEVGILCVRAILDL